MNRKTIILASLAATMGAMSASAQVVLVGFENWATNNPNGGANVTNAATTTAAGFNGNSITATTGWGRSSSGASTDGTFGTFAGADTGTQFHAGLSLNNGVNGSYNFTITNSSGSDIDLGEFHFDTATLRPNAAHEWEVVVLEGSNITSGIVSSGSADNITGGVNDWYDYDLSLTGLADNTLENGGSATFQLIMSGGIPTSGHTQYVDSIAITSVPEPGTYALLGGLIALFFVVRRRTSGATT